MNTSQPQHINASVNGNPAPVVIGATGGSGTRAFHSVLQGLGLFMGVRLNGAGDAMDFEPFLDQWINPLIGMDNRLDYTLSKAGFWRRWCIRRDFDKAYRAFTADRPAHAPWGWKNPRSMYVLPVIADRVPDFRFLHVVRDGRDMALSDNQNQRRKHFQALFGPQTNDRDSPAASATLWSMANLQAADWGESVLQERYLRIRLEDICAEPERHVAAIARWLGLPDTPGFTEKVTVAAQTIQAPSSLGRWRQAEEKDRQMIEDAAREALGRFGYLD